MSIEKDKRRIFSKTQKIQLYKIYDGKCGICDNTFSSIEEVYNFDHIIPWNLGGRTEIENGQPICKECGLKKNKEDTTQAARVKRVSKKNEPKTPLQKKKFGVNSKLSNQNTFSNNNKMNNLKRGF